eukprot:CAMPEP_0197655502 /NCGR_PEP_ID=MMETSP1338-20131121/39485_1 /TAXON_ID=43686 ORGANISM="Pelagodinium beii, Strain RCC1491" /NCGR_SAMPLE_ID=MMETSP1338 /ASSEMBLY_ACC=CAM_ASM_000754 /LENGTH=896 /DNA_ID=CAMNT_0043231155 /DNA_START=107 /DNA_END=2797 /DNA_ORIENTATION=-
MSKAGGKIGSELLRATAEKYSGGRTDLLPGDIDDPELLLRALVRKFTGELQAAAKRQNIAEGHASSLAKRLELEKATNSEARDGMDTVAKELKQYQEQVGKYQSKIAFLGARWETLTGVPNEELMADPAAAARQNKQDLRAARSEVYVAGLTLRSQKKEIEIIKALLAENEARERGLNEELVQTRLKDEDLVMENIRVTHVCNKLKQELEEQTKLVAEEKEKVKILDARVRESQAGESVAVREKESIERTIGHFKKDIKSAKEELVTVQSKTAEAAETSLIAIKQAEKQEVIVKRLTVQVADLEAKLVEEKKWSKSLQKDLAIVKSELEVITGDKQDITVKSKVFEKTGILERKRANTAEVEVQGLAASVAHTSSQLVLVTQQLSDEKKKVLELQDQLVKVKADVKEYQALAADRKKRLDRSEKELEQARSVTKEIEMRELIVAKELREKKVLLGSAVEREKDAESEVVRVAMTLDTTQQQYLSAKSEGEKRVEVIEDLRVKLAESQAYGKSYRSKSEQLEEELATTKVRVTESEERAFTLKIERDKARAAIVKEQETVDALGGNLDIMQKQLKANEDVHTDAVAREAVLRKEVAALKVEVKEAKDKAISFETSLGVVEKEREVYKTQAGEMVDDVVSKKQALRKFQSQLSYTATDLSGVKESHDRLAKQLGEARRAHAESDAEAKRLEKELKTSQSELKASRKTVAWLNNKVEELTGQLEESLTEASQEKFTNKQLGMKIKQQVEEKKQIEIEEKLAKASIVQVCDDYKVLEDKFTDETTVVKELRGDVAAWKKKYKDLDIETADLKDITWRIKQDLETSKLAEREHEVMLKKLTAEMKTLKPRLADAEAKNLDLTGNVSRLMKAWKEEMVLKEAALKEMEVIRATPQKKLRKKA